jgi:GNAT superfamily N-acetyltransferase
MVDDPFRCAALLASSGSFFGTMPQAKIREFEHSDYPALVQVNDSLFPHHPYFLKRIEFEDSCYGRTRYQMKRFVAENESGHVVGFGEYEHLFFSFHPQRFALGIEVHPQWQRQGIGGMLYDRVVHELAKAGAKVASPSIPSTSASGIEFVRKRGFVEKSRTVESRLDLGMFDPTSFAKVVERLEGEGITIADFSSELRDDPSAGKKLKDVEDDGAVDVPHAVTDNLMDYHDYEIIILNSPIMIWEGSFVAKEGGVYVGSSSLFESGIEGVIDQGFTVVRRGYRGRGIAQAVKLRTALFAKKKGMRYIRTYNDSENAPMLAVNRKMGFAKQAEWIVFEKEL